MVIKMFNSDSPITKLDEDSLGRDNFAINLGDRIIEHKSPNNENLVIGIAGEWGSGKSSLMNMVLDHIEKEYINSNELNDNEKPIIMCFNPWRFSNQDQLLYQFFYEMGLLLGRTDYENIRDIARKVEIYASFFEPVGIALPPFGVIIKVLKRYLNAIQEWADYKSNDLDKTKKELDEALKNQKHKIIIALDDIDRLNVEEIHLIFQLIKVLADFPNTVYLVGFDREVVSAALTNDQIKLSGSDYLEKIIQVIFEIPHITEDEIKNLVIQSLEKDFDKFENESDKYDFDNRYNSLLKHKIKNIRNFNRYINTLKLTYDSIKDDVFNADYYTIIAVQVFFPEVYHFILKNKELLLYDYIYSLNYPHNKEEIKNELDEAIVNLNSFNIPNQDFKSFLISLFPNLKRIYSNEDNRHFMNEWKLKKRICIEENFETYFKFAVPSWELSKKDFDEIVYSETDEMIKGILALPPNLQIKFINSLHNIIQQDYYNFNETTKKNIVETMYCIGDTIQDKSSFYPYIIECSLKSMDSKRVFITLKNAILKSNNLSTICELSYGIFKDLRKDKPEKDAITLKESQVNELKLIVIKEIKNFILSNELCELKNPFYILQVWKDFGDEKGVTEYMNRIKAPDLLILMKILTNREGLSEESVSKAIDNLTELINLKILNNKIDNIILSDKLEKEDLDILNSFNKVVLNKLKPQSFVDSLKEEI